VEWLRCTYFYVRAKRVPGMYGIPLQPSPEALDRWLKDKMVLSTVGQLAEHGMVGAVSGMGGGSGWQMGYRWKVGVRGAGCVSMARCQGR